MDGGPEEIDTAEATIDPSVSILFLMDGGPEDCRTEAARRQGELVSILFLMDGGPEVTYGESSGAVSIVSILFLMDGGPEEYPDSCMIAWIDSFNPFLDGWWARSPIPGFFRPWWNVSILFLMDGGPEAP